MYELIFTKFRIYDQNQTNTSKNLVLPSQISIYSYNEWRLGITMCKLLFTVDDITRERSKMSDFGRNKC